MSFVAVLDSAVAGTQRQAPAATSMLGNDDTLAAEQQLLRAAAVEGLRRLAGRPLARHTSFTSIPLCPPETLDDIPHAAAARLSELLAEHRELLPEWLRLVAERHLRAPHGALPELLDYARDVISLRPLVQAVGGERLRWLAGLNADWSFAAAFDNPAERFETGSRTERIEAFTRLRAADPARARELLAANWQSERADTRGVLIALLVDHLSADDETLLEEALRSSRKEVRGSALHLLRQLPASSFALRWTQRARAIADLRQHSVLGFRRATLNVTVPPGA